MARSYHAVLSGQNCDLNATKMLDVSSSDGCRTGASETTAGSRPSGSHRSAKHRPSRIRHAGRLRTSERTNIAPTVTRNSRLSIWVETAHTSALPGLLRVQTFPSDFIPWRSL